MRFPSSVSDEYFRATGNRTGDTTPSSLLRKATLHEPHKLPYLVAPQNCHRGKNFADSIRHRNTLAVLSRGSGRGSFLRLLPLSLLLRPPLTRRFTPTFD